jgi:hypothetical protein
MRSGAGRRYVGDELELEAFREGVKRWRCPHCGRLGALNAHGRSMGYGDGNGVNTLRGRRFYCSNRRRRPGCGRTFSVLLSEWLSGFVVSALVLYRFLRAVVSGVTRSAAWTALGTGMPVRSGYRLWCRTQSAQLNWRFQLNRVASAPSHSGQVPFAQVMAHFECVFMGPRCPLAAFQERFQVGLFG